jgi:hypothetical protein
MSEYNGVATGAKIAFFDIGDTASSTLVIPSNLSLRMFPPGYTAGARVFSNSWGSSATSYTYLGTRDSNLCFFVSVNLGGADGNEEAEKDETRVFSNSWGVSPTSHKRWLC